MQLSKRGQVQTLLTRLPNKRGGWEGKEKLCYFTKDALWRGFCMWTMSVWMWLWKRISMAEAKWALCWYVLELEGAFLNFGIRRLTGPQILESAKFLVGTEMHSLDSCMELLPCIGSHGKLSPTPAMYCSWFPCVPSTQLGFRFAACFSQHMQWTWPGISDVPLLCLSYCMSVKNSSNSIWRELLGGKKIKMSRKARCCCCYCAGLARSEQVWALWLQTSCTWLFGSAVDLVSYCVRLLSCKIHSSVDINNWRFTVRYNC